MVWNMQKVQRIRPEVLQKCRNYHVERIQTTGHWEMAGIVTSDPLPKFPDGFPKVFIEEFSKRTGRKILCNLPYLGTQVIHDYGREQEETGALIL